MGALREVFERDVFGVVRGDVSEDLLCAEGVAVFSGLAVFERCMGAQEQNEREEA